MFVDEEGDTLPALPPSPSLPPATTLPPSPAAPTLPAPANDVEDAPLDAVCAGQCAIAISKACDALVGHLARLRMTPETRRAVADAYVRLESLAFAAARALDGCER